MGQLGQSKAGHKRQQTGVGQRSCQGLRRGLVADMEKTEGAIRAAMDQAERNAGVQVEDVFVNLSAGTTSNTYDGLNRAYIRVPGARPEGETITR